MTLTEGRDELLRRLEEDLIGPVAVAEVLKDRPSDRYLTGILAPMDTGVPPEEDEVLGAGENDDDDEPADLGISLGRTIRPATRAGTAPPWC